MTDINGTVVGIQGREIDDTAPSDGYALIWDEGNTKWKPKPNGLNRQYFTSNGTWTCPEGIISILIIASGGGSGASAGFAGTFDYVDQSGPAGINAIQVVSTLIVIPGTVYTIIIGAGGIGGTGPHIITDVSNTIVVERSDPTAGSSTSFSQDETVLFSVRGATPFDTPPDLFINTYNDGYEGSPAISYVNGSGGYGGLAGPQGNGGNGGDGAVSLSGGPAVASNGFNAGDNTGAGGGSGGNCGFDDFPCDCTAGNGGNGGSGYMYIVY